MPGVFSLDVQYATSTLMREFNSILSIIIGELVVLPLLIVNLMEVPD